MCSLVHVPFTNLEEASLLLLGINQVVHLYTYSLWFWQLHVAWF